MKAPKAVLSNIPDPISNWQDLVRVWTELENSKRRWLYRGHSSVDYELKPRIERAINRLNIPITSLPIFEKRTIRQAQRNLFRYDSDLPESDDIVEWLSILQHYGAPTRLLDWTYSFHVGLYFAIGKAAIDKVASIFIADNDALVFEKEDQVKIGMIYSAYRKHDKDTRVDRYLLDNDFNRIVPITPFRLNERLAMQQGIFMISLSHSRAFYQIYQDMSRKHPDSFYRLNIRCTPNLLERALVHLQRANITDVTLFPGIDGYCRSIENELLDPRADSIYSGS